MNISLTILQLLQLPRIGPKTVGNILDEIINDKKYSFSDGYELADLILSLKKNPTLRIPHFDKNEMLQHFTSGTKIYETSIENEVFFVTKYDQHYPENLRKLKHPPLLIHFKGNLEAYYNKPSVAVIGTRDPTEHGYKLGLRIGELLGSSNNIVVSGLAKGIDTAGHEGCLKVGGTAIGVLAQGLLTDIYPKENRILANKILDTGGVLLTEYATYERPQRSYFVERDRIQAGLSHSVFVVETGVVGGTMHTVSFAQECKIPIFVYDHPDNLKNNEKAQGNQMLIKAHRAKPIGTAPEINGFLSDMDSFRSKMSITHSKFETALRAMKTVLLAYRMPINDALVANERMMSQIKSPLSDAIKIQKTLTDAFKSPLHDIIRANEQLTKHFNPMHEAFQRQRELAQAITKSSEIVKAKGYSNEIVKAFKKEFQYISKLPKVDLEFRLTEPYDLQPRIDFKILAKFAKKAANKKVNTPIKKGKKGKKPKGNDSQLSLL